MLRANLSLDSMIGLLILSPDMIQHGDTLATGGTTSWTYAAKTSIWKVASTGLQLAVFALLILLARRTKMADPLLWPFAFIVVAWVSPLSWVYYFIAAFLFLPAFLDRIGTAGGAIALVLVLAPTNSTLFLTGITSDLDPVAFAIINSVSLLLACGLFLWLALRDKGSSPLSG